MRFTWILFAAVSAMLSPAVRAADITLIWTQDTSACADGSAVINCPISGVEVSQQNTQGVWSVKETLAASALNRTYTGVVPGHYCFRLRNASSGSFSDYSNTACIDIAFVSPRAPLGAAVQKVTVTLTSTAAK